MFNKNVRKSLPILVLVAVLVWMVCSCMGKPAKVSKYSLENAAPIDMSASAINPNLKRGGECAVGAGTGLASSLLPREVASQEDFGQFAPDDILKGQNFLDPRKQIGYPETIGGNLRNANQQIRAEPPNPKKAYVWNNSTIVPDLMQRSLC